jgi:alkylation response protein AidB-like acyl-CoA dehydrogenase
VSYLPPVREHLFLLRDVLAIEQYADLPGFSDASYETIGQVLEEAAKFNAEVLAPLNAVGDKQGCRWNPDHSVVTPDGFKEAYRALVEAGWPALGADPAWGGQGLPAVVNLAVSEMSSSANMAFGMYPGLTHGAYSAIEHGGTADQKALYLPRLASGQWAGTMNLTEPQCGTDLGLLRTKAVPTGDGAYRITGEKIWISGGEHDLAENIIHLVLARIEGAPTGTRGISLFIVPKYIPNPDGSLGPRNGVVCAGLESKMGIHGNATCVMVHDGAVGWLIGEENRGLAVMFVMMNEARLGVGLQGLAQGETAYQAAVAFARERRQGRSLTGPKDPGEPADSILVHPDVRRMLLDSRAILEGGRAFLFWTALHGDLARRHPDETVRQRGEDYMGLLTPVLKGYLTDRGFAVCSDCMQVYGGSGFTETYTASQALRDCRITMIYEGTNGVQALDLVGRKLGAKGGRAVMAFLAEIDTVVAAESADGDLQPFVGALAAAKAQLQQGTLWLMRNGLTNPDDAAAASTDYMHLFGLTGLAFMWALMAKAALARIAGGDTDPFYANKLLIGRHFIERVLPLAGAHLARLESGSANLMSFPSEAF